MGLGLDPMMAGFVQSLAGTLTDPEQQQMEELRQRAAATQQAAQQAGGAYQEAAAAPAPQLPLADIFIPTLLGNIASTIAQQPRYAEEAQKEVQTSRATLMKQRADNLQALRDVYSQKADEAAKAGDLEEQLKNRTLLERTNRLHETVLANAKAAADREARAEEQRQRHLDRLAEIAAGKTPAEPVDIEPLITETASGRKFVDLGSLTGKEKNAAIAQAGKQGLVALGSVDAVGVRDVDRARRDIDSLERYLGDLLPRDAKGRIAAAPGMKLQKLLQTNEKRAAFKTFRDVAIPTLRAMAGSRGLRITQQQIELSVQNLPKDTDTYGTAQRKLQIIRKILNNAEDPLVSRNWRRQQPGNPKGDALEALRSGDTATARTLIQQNPKLNNDPEILSAIEALKR